MTDLVTSPQSRVLDIQRLLRESYGSGFTIFKELVQNAEDAFARRLILASHEGFPGAANPLLRAPGLFIANDGPVIADHWKALKFASGGGKGADRDSVGRFGLGQKALYHLCDAFVVFAWIADADGTARSMVLNPFENIPQATAAGCEWRDPLAAADEALLAGWTEAHGLNDGLALYVPLRTASLRPGPGAEAGTTLSLRDRNWTPDEAVEDILDGKQLIATLACLRRLERIEIKPLHAPTRMFTVSAGASRLSGPNATDGESEAIAGTLMLPAGQARFHGRQRRSPDGPTAALLDAEGWQPEFDMAGQPVRPKASPHGAAVICRHPLTRGETARLRAWQAVYLPLGDPDNTKSGSAPLMLVDEEFAPGSEHVDIVVHGDFFVTSDRAALRRDGSIYSHWNQALLAEVALPVVLDAVHAALCDMPADPERVSLVRALGGSPWWRGNATAVCGSRALARCRSGGEVRWVIAEAQSLRPLPERPSTSPARLKSVWNGFAIWYEERGVMPAYGTTLSAQPVQWPDSELATLIGNIGASAFAEVRAAETLADILEHVARNGGVGPEAKAALGASLREVLRGKGRVAPTEQMKRLTAFLPSAQVFVLPKAAADKDLLAALAKLPDTLCIKDEWSDLQAQPSRNLSVDEAAALLQALAPLAAGPGRMAEQAVSVIAQVMRQGPKLGVLARHGQLATVRFFPVVRVSDGALLLIDPSRAEDLVQRRLLFQQGPASLIAPLAAAIVRPEIFQVRPHLGDLALDLASGNSKLDRAKVVMQVAEFGPPHARAALLSDLGTELERPFLRRLVAGDAGLPDRVSLARLDGIDVVLEPLVQALLGSSSDIRVIDPCIAGVLTGNQQIAIGLDRLDAQWLARQLATRAAALPELNDAQAMALLRSGVPDAQLRGLALHRAEGKDGLHAADGLVLGQIRHVPDRLRARVASVRLWEDPDVAAVQRRLIQPWSPERQVALALQTDEPHLAMEEIALALKDCQVLDDQLGDQLRAAVWLALPEGPSAPADLRNLPADALHALGANGAGLLLRSPENLPDPVVRQLQRHDLMPSELPSFGAALGDLRNAGVHGLALDPDLHWPDLRKLAKAKCALGGGVWPFLSSMLRSVEEDQEVSNLLRGARLPRPGLADIIAQLNDLAAACSEPGSVAEAAGRIHRAMFDQNREELAAPQGFFPADLMLRSEAGGFARARDLALDARGIAPSAHVWRGYGLKLPDQQAGAEEKLEVRRSIAEAMRELLVPFEPYFDLHLQVVMVLALLGGNAGLRQVAERFQAARSFDDIRSDLDERARMVDAPCGTITARLKDIELRPALADGGGVRVRSAAGTICTVLPDGREETMLVSYGQYRENTNPAGRRIKTYPLTLAQVTVRDEDHGARILAGFVQTVDRRGKRTPLAG